MNLQNVIAIASRAPDAKGRRWVLFIPGKPQENAERFYTYQEAFEHKRELMRY